MSAVRRNLKEAGCGEPINPRTKLRSDVQKLNKQISLADREQHILHLILRHTFATCLLEADVDIQYFQVMLIHSSIKNTEIGSLSRVS